MAGVSLGGGGSVIARLFLDIKQFTGKAGAAGKAYGVEMDKMKKSTQGTGRVVSSTTGKMNKDLNSVSQQADKTRQKLAHVGDGARQSVSGFNAMKAGAGAAFAGMGASMMAFAQTSTQKAMESMKGWTNIFSLQHMQPKYWDTIGKKQKTWAMEFAESNGVATGSVKDAIAQSLTFGNSWKETQKQMKVSTAIAVASGRDISASQKMLQYAYMNKGRIFERLTGIELKYYKTADGKIDREKLNAEIMRRYGQTVEDYRNTEYAQLVRAEDAYNRMYVTIGSQLVPVISPLISGLIGILGAFNSMSPLMKQITAGAIIMVAAMSLIEGPIMLLSGLGFNMNIAAGASARLGAAWGWATATLNGLTLATIRNTVATKAQTIWQGINAAASARWQAIVRWAIVSQYGLMAASGGATGGLVAQSIAQVMASGTGTQLVIVLRAMAMAVWGVAKAVISFLLTNPIGWIILIGVAIVGIITYFNQWGAIVNWFKGVFSGAGKAIGGTIAWIGSIVTPVFNGIVKSISETVGWIVKSLQAWSGWKIIGDTLKWVFFNLTPIGIVIKYIMGAMNGLKGTNGIWTSISNAVKPIGGFLMWIWNGLKGIGGAAAKAVAGWSGWKSISGTIQWIVASAQSLLSLLATGKGSMSDWKSMLIGALFLPIGLVTSGFTIFQRVIAGVTSQFNTFKNSADGKQLFSTLSMAVAQLKAAFASVWDALSDGWKEVSPAFGELGRALGLIAPPAKTVGTEVKKAGNEVKKAGGAPTKGASSGFNAITLILGGLVTAIKYAIPVIQFLASVFKFVAWVIGGVAKVVKTFVNIFTFLVKTNKTMTTATNKSWQDLWKKAKLVFERIKNAIWNPIKWVIDKYKTGWRVLNAVLFQIWMTLRGRAIQAFALIKAAIITPVQNTFNWLRNGWLSIVGIIFGIWGGLKTKAYNTFLQIKGFIWNPINKAITDVKNAFNALKSVAGTAWNSIRDTVVGAINKILDPLKKLYCLIKGCSPTGLIKVFGELSKTLPGKITGWARNQAAGFMDLGVVANMDGGPAGFKGILEALIGRRGKYKFYFGDKYSVPETIQGGVGNCFDWTQVVMALASAFGLNSSMVHGSWNGIPHVWANVGGIGALDPAARIIRGTWAPPSAGPGPAGACCNPMAILQGVLPRPAGPGSTAVINSITPVSSSQQSNSVTVIIEGPVYGISDLDAKIKRIADKRIFKQNSVDKRTGGH